MCIRYSVELDCTDPALLRSWSAIQVYFAADAVAEAAGQYEAGVMSKVNCLTVAFNVTRMSNYAVSYTNLRAHESVIEIECWRVLENKRERRSENRAK